VPINVRPGVGADADLIVQVAKAAFVTEPAVQYFFAAGYEQHAPAFFRYLLDLRLDGGEVWVAEFDDVVAAVAMWNPPGGVTLSKAEQHERWERAASTFPPDVRERLEGYDAFLEDHHPAENNHYYLGVLATQPSLQGKGLAGAVMAPTFEAADSQAVSCYLETGTPDNVGYYQRHSFEVDATVDLPDGPRIWWMHRPAQQSVG